MNKPESTYAVEVSGVYKRFPKFKRYREMLIHPFRREEVSALNGVDLKVKKGELFVLLGPNGAGKSTLIKILSTLIMPNEGTATVNGYDVTTQGDNIRRSIGYVISEERSFYWRLTGRQNLEFFASLYNLFGKDAERRIDEVLEMIDLTPAADKMFKDYSTGMRQKLAIARGLLTEPDLLFMDEPTRSLDPTSSEHLKDFVANHLVKDQGKTVFFTTHNLREAEICDSLAVIHQGKIRFSASMEEIRGGRRDFVVGLTSTENGIIDKIRQMDMIESHKTIPVRPGGPELEIQVRLCEGKGDVSDLIGEIVSLGGKIIYCFPRDVPLRDIYNRAISQ